MHKDNSAALLLYIMTQGTICLTTRKPSLPPEFGATGFSFCFDGECSITSGERLAFVVWEGF